MAYNQHEVDKAQVAYFTVLEASGKSDHHGKNAGARYTAGTWVTVLYFTILGGMSTTPQGHSPKGRVHPFSVAQRSIVVN